MIPYSCLIGDILAKLKSQVKNILNSKNEQNTPPAEAT